jgi:hypothetical protein
LGRVVATHSCESGFSGFRHGYKIGFNINSPATGQINPTKNERSERELPYGEIISDALGRLRASGQGGKEYLFVTPRGTFFRSSDVGKKAFRRAAKALELPEITWRSFRRSVETLLHTEGVPMKFSSSSWGIPKLARRCSMPSRGYQSDGKLWEKSRANCCQMLPSCN